MKHSTYISALEYHPFRTVLCQIIQHSLRTRNTNLGNFMLIKFNMTSRSYQDLSKWCNFIFCDTLGYQFRTEMKIPKWPKIPILINVYYKRHLNLTLKHLFLLISLYVFTEQLSEKAQLQLKHFKMFASALSTSFLS